MYINLTFILFLCKKLTGIEIEIYIFAFCQALQSIGTAIISSSFQIIVLWLYCYRQLFRPKTFLQSCFCSSIPNNATTNGWRVFFVGSGKHACERRWGNCPHMWTYSTYANVATNVYRQWTKKFYNVLVKVEITETDTIASNIERVWRQINAILCLNVNSIDKEIYR